MLAGDALAPQFVGGRVYQANLRSLNYHRWHSPATGTLVEAYVVPGAYHPERSVEDFDGTRSEKSVAHSTHFNTRAGIFKKAENPDMGLMCFQDVGLCEGYPKDVTVDEGQEAAGYVPVRRSYILPSFPARG